MAWTAAAARGAGGHPHSRAACAPPLLAYWRVNGRGLTGKMEPSPPTAGQRLGPGRRLALYHRDGGGGAAAEHVAVGAHLPRAPPAPLPPLPSPPRRRRAGERRQTPSLRRAGAAAAAAAAAAGWRGRHSPSRCQWSLPPQEPRRRRRSPPIGGDREGCVAGAHVIDARQRERRPRARAAAPALRRVGASQRPLPPPRPPSGRPASAIVVSAAAAPAALASGHTFAVLRPSWRGAAAAAAAAPQWSAARLPVWAAGAPLTTNRSAECFVSARGQADNSASGCAAAADGGGSMAREGLASLAGRIQVLERQFRNCTASAVLFARFACRCLSMALAPLVVFIGWQAPRRFVMLCAFFNRGPVVPTPGGWRLA